MNLPSYRTLLGLAGLLVAAPGWAGEWNGKFSAGAIASSGNSKTSTVQLDLGLGYVQGAWEYKLKGIAVHARSEEEDEATGETQSKTTTERYALGARAAVDLSESNFLFVQLDAEKDLFGGVRERTVETVGYGRHLLRLKAHKLDLEIGAGARQLKAQAAGAERESEVVGRLGLNYLWTLTESSSFSQTLTLESGEENNYTESVSNLKLSVIGGVFANLGFTVKNNSEVPADTENTDTITSVSLSYEF